MTHTITTANSTYEVDWDPGRIRRLTGANDPTPYQGTDGEWQDATLTLTPANQLWIDWVDRPGQATITSPITTITEASPMTALLGLAGYAGTGKDALAEHLADWTRVAFADKIRAVAYDLDTTVAEAVDDTDWEQAKREVPYVREYLQFIGQVMRADLGADVWLNAVLQQLPAGPVVITDVRMPNEADAIKALGGRVIEITRPGVGPANGHVTELGLDGYNFDASFSNDRTPALLAVEVLVWLEGL